MVRALDSQQYSPGSNPGVDSICDMWVEFVVGSSLAPRGFSPDTPVSPLLQNQRISKFQFDLERTDMFKRVLKNS